MPEKYSEDVCGLAICFSRMWGIAETLEPFPDIGFEKVKELALAWARECVERKETDIVDFFVKSLEKGWPEGDGCSGLEVSVKQALHIPEYQKPDSQE